MLDNPHPSTPGTPNTPADPPRAACALAISGWPTAGKRDSEGRSTRGRAAWKGVPALAASPLLHRPCLHLAVSDGPRHPNQGSRAPAAATCRREQSGTSAHPSWAVIESPRKATRYSRCRRSCSSRARFSQPVSMCSRAKSGKGGSAAACCRPSACNGGQVGWSAVGLGTFWSRSQQQKRRALSYPVRHPWPSAQGEAETAPGLCLQRPARSPGAGSRCQQHVQTAVCIGGSAHWHQGQPSRQAAGSMGPGSAIGTIGAPPAIGSNRDSHGKPCGASESRAGALQAAPSVRGHVPPRERQRMQYRTGESCRGQAGLLARCPAAAPLPARPPRPLRALCAPPDPRSQPTLVGVAAAEAEQHSPAAAALPPLARHVRRHCSPPNAARSRPPLLLCDHPQVPHPSTRQDVQPGLRRRPQHGLRLPGRRPAG